MTAAGEPEAMVASVSGRPLSGRRALLTGSVGGLGLAMAGELARAGCDLMLNGIDPSADVEPRYRELAEEAGVRIVYQQADLSRESGVRRLVDAATAELGGIDILVNNAVVRHFAPIVDFPAEQWDAALAVNLSAAFHAIRLTLPGMRERNFGRIFNITSVYGLRGTPDRVGYVTTKSALLGLTRSVALENLDCDVTCHSICPGSVLTPGTDERVVEIMDNERIDRAAAERAFLAGKQPGGQFVSPESVGTLLVFLCGPIARDMTGALLPVEAGWLAS
ncbi:SDR family NAD(P)-dependent oxidoreductase [Microbaculum marinum]|uniref:SDR family NAD(P)-dependent oxidoreductase n=1 Tax=Microbaculum marinum TaxID=1764581 RepID=A0AAW9RVP6_9HYPH